MAPLRHGREEIPQRQEYRIGGFEMGLMARPGDFDQASPGQLIHEGTGAFPGEDLALASAKDQGWTLHR